MPAPLVLVVDDEPSILRTVAITLGRAGYDVRAANGPLDALDYLARTRIPVDLLLCDVNMPGLSGIGFVDRVREQLPDLRVLYMTGDPRRAVQLSDADVLVKPFHGEQLCGTVAAVLGRSGIAAPAERTPPEPGTMDPEAR